MPGFVARMIEGARTACVIAIGLVAGGCAAAAPQDLGARDRAERTFREICGGSFVEDPAIVAPDTVIRIDPVYGHTFTGANASGTARVKLGGARLTLRVRPGWTSFQVSRTLLCHQSRLLLDGRPVPDDDPYVLPGRWLTMDVESGNDGLAVVLSTDHFEDAREVLQRARRFVRWQDRRVP